MGRPQFEQVVASAPKEYMKFDLLSQTVTVPKTTGVHSILLYAPKGYMGELTAMFARVGAVSGATSGSNILTIGYNNISNASGTSSYNQMVQWYGNHWQTADLQQYPPTTQEQSRAFMGLIFDDVIPFRLTYANQTNADATGEISLRLVYKLRQVAK